MPAAGSLRLLLSAIRLSACTSSIMSAQETHHNLATIGLYDGLIQTKIKM